MILHKRRMGDEYSSVRVLGSPFAQRPFVESTSLRLLCHDPSWYVHREEYVCRTCKFEHCPNLTMRSVDRIEKVMLTGSTLFSESRRYPAASHHVPIRPRTVQYLQIVEKDPSEASSPGQKCQVDRGGVAGTGPSVFRTQSPGGLAEIRHQSFYATANLWTVRWLIEL